MKKFFKKNGAITLIALVITIIVLLILAGVAIASLTGNNGILRSCSIVKRKNWKSTNNWKCKIRYNGKIARKKGENLSNTELEEILTSSNYNTQGTLSNEENILDRTLTSKDGKYEIPVLEIYNGMLASSITTSAIDYGDKTAETIDVLDDLTIGTEKFKVIKKVNNTIHAIAYYNLVLNSNPIVQATAENAGTSVGNAGTVAFQEYRGWYDYDPPSGDIDLENEENNLKQYIDGYQITLSNHFRTSNVTAKIPRVTDMPAWNDPYGAILRNPSLIGYYWIGTRPMNCHGNLYYCKPEGIEWSMDDDFNYYETDYVGVRPIIEITF